MNRSLFSKFLLSTMLLVSSAWTSGCYAPPAPPQRSTLEIRAAQSRTFEYGNEQLVLRAALNTLQDQGFVTKSGIVELGLIIAVKETSTSSFAQGAIHAAILGSDARWATTEVVETNVSVSPFGKGVRVRINCVKKVLDNMGAIMEVQEVVDPVFYQDFFTKLDKSIMIQRERI